MFTRLRFENFKAWKDTGDIRPKPLTVFFGGNSSGKTSLVQALLLLKQTAESSDRKRVLHTGDREHTPVDLGTPQQVVFEQNDEGHISFHLSWTLPNHRTYFDPSHEGRVYEADECAFEVDVRLLGGRPVVDRFDYRLWNEGELSCAVGMHRRDNGTRSDTYELETENFVAVRDRGRRSHPASVTRFYGFPDEVIAGYQNTSFLLDLNLALEQKFGDLLYLGPLRGYPRPWYSWSGEEPEHVGWRGERTVEAMLAARDRRISAGYNQRYRPFLQVIAEWLKRLGLLTEFEVRPVAEGRKEHEVMVRTGVGTPWVNLTDVGFGISQFLPVVVQIFYAPAGSTIILEQPEIHLHPRVQATMADLFIEAIRAREDGEDRGIQLIIESHSEHFLRRLQRRVAEEALSPDEVALYFARAGEAGEGSHLEELEVDEFGNISNWPPNFFGDEMEDMVAMTEAAMRRRLGGHE